MELIVVIQMVIVALISAILMYFPIKKVLNKDYNELKNFKWYEMTLLLLGIGFLVFSISSAITGFGDDTGPGLNNIATVAGYFLAAAVLLSHANKRRMAKVIYALSYGLIVYFIVYLFQSTFSNSTSIFDDMNGALVYAVVGMIIISEVYDRIGSRSFKECSAPTCSKPKQDWKYLNFCTGCEQTFCKHCIDDHIKQCKKKKIGFN